MFASFIVGILTGFPVAWVLGGVAIGFTAIAVIVERDFGYFTGVDWSYASLVADRIWDLMDNWVLVALPMFVCMGLLFDRAGNRGRPHARRLAPLRPDARRPRRDGRADRRRARRKHRHHRRLGRAPRPARTAPHARGALRPDLCGRHRLRRRHARHPDSTEHHARTDGGPTGHVRRRSVSRRILPGAAARQPLHRLHPHLLPAFRPEVAPGPRRRAAGRPGPRDRGLHRGASSRSRADPRRARQHLLRHRHPDRGLRRRRLRRAAARRLARPPFDGGVLARRAAPRRRARRATSSGSSWAPRPSRSCCGGSAATS